MRKIKVTRAFARLGAPPTPEEWKLRMDSLLCADPSELLEFVSDAILVLTVKSNSRDLSEMLGIVTEACRVEGTETVLEMLEHRWKDIEASLGEHLDRSQMRERLAGLSRTAPWE